MTTSKKLFIAAAVYVALLVILILLLSLIIPHIDAANQLQQGCYITDAMVSYVVCKGFLGHSLISFLLNMPYQLIYSPVFGVIIFLRAPWLILIAALYWAPVVYFIFYLLKHDHPSAADHTKPKLRKL